MKNKINIIYITLLVLIILSIIILILTNVFNKTIKKDEVKVIDVIETYNYSLKENKTDLYKTLYYELKNNLSINPVNEEEYAKLVAQLLVLDFYDLESKYSKNDIGGTQFILDDYVNDFKKEALNTVYKYVEHNLYGNRDQDLPKITNIEANSIKKVPYIYNDYQDNNGYEVVVQVEYEKDLGYPTEVTVKLIHQDNILKVFSMN